VSKYYPKFFNLKSAIDRRIPIPEEIVPSKIEAKMNN
jgi:hypothetical protein